MRKDEIRNLGKNVLNQDVKMLAKELKDGYVHCDTCGGVGYILMSDGYLNRCPDCRETGLLRACIHCGKPMKHGYCKNPKCKALNKHEHLRFAYDSPYVNNIDDTIPPVIIDADEVFKKYAYVCVDYFGVCSSWDDFFRKWDDYVEEVYEIDDESSIECMKQDRPKYASMCSAERIEVDVEGFLECTFDDIDLYYDDIDSDKLDELEKILNTWLEENTDPYNYVTNYDIQTKIPWEQYDVKKCWNVNE